MKAKFLALAAMVLGMASCQTDVVDGVKVDANGEAAVTISVGLPEDGTRADSALGAIDNNVDLNQYDIRFILAVYDKDGYLAKGPMVKHGDATEESFSFRLVPGREYNFVAWADFVANDTDTDFHYDTTEFPVVSLKDGALQNLNDESRDAYTAVVKVENFSGASSMPKMTLKRPFAKLRVVTTDMDQLYSNLKQSTIDYTTKIYTSFNALSSKVEGDAEYISKKVVAYTETDVREGAYADYVYGEPTDGKMTLFADYLFGGEDDRVMFTMYVEDYTTNVIPTIEFNTNIPVQRNYLTTVQGPILTDPNNITVTIEDDFENADNTTDAPYYQQAVTNGVELIKALLAGYKIIVLNDITVTAADLAAATRAGEAIYPVINLNGFTITIENENAAALVNLNGGALTVEGEGTIESTVGALVEGTTVVTESADVDAKVAVDANGNSTVKSGLEALVYICENGGEFNFTENLTIDEVILVSTTKPVVINGANHTLTSNATRAIRATVADANIVVNDLNIVVTTERVGTNDIRGISIDDVTGVELTLNNCSVIFNHPSANDWAYAVNVTGGSNHKVTVNGGTYNGANVINVRGANQTVVVKNAILNCWYPNNDEYYGACIYVVQKQESSVYAEGNTFNGDNAVAFNIGNTSLEEKNNTDNTKRVAAKVGGVYYYNIAEAIKAVENDATVMVLQNHACNEPATVAAGKTITLDLNGKTITGTDKNTAGNFYLIDNRGTLTISDSSEAKTGAIKLSAETERNWNASSVVVANNPGGKLVINGGLIEHLGGTSMAYGVDNLTNGKGTYAETVINGGTIKSTYRAVRMFLNGIEAQNLLTVNGGTIEGANKSIWMQDPSANANTGTLVVNEGATLNGDVYLFVTAGSTSWPVSVSIAASAVNGEVLTGNVPAGYEVVNKGGVWTVVAYTEVSTADELIAALEANESVKFKNDIKIEPAAMSNAYGATGINIKNGQTIDGNGYTLNIKGAGGTWDSGINTTGGLIKNLTVTGSFRGIFINHTGTHSEKVVLENVTIGGNGTVYTISCDQGLYQGIEATNCTFNGWTSFAKTAGEAKFVNCSFGEGSGYKYCRPYSNTEFVNCIFCPGYTVDQSQATVTFTDCTWEE